MAEWISSPSLEVSTVVRKKYRPIGTGTLLFVATLAIGCAPSAKEDAVPENDEVERSASPSALVPNPAADPTPVFNGLTADKLGLADPRRDHEYFMLTEKQLVRFNAHLDEKFGVGCPSGAGSYVAWHGEVSSIADGLATEVTFFADSKSIADFRDSLIENAQQPSKDAIHWEKYEVGQLDKPRRVLEFHEYPRGALTIRFSGSRAANGSRKDDRAIWKFDPEGEAVTYFYQDDGELDH